MYPATCYAGFNFPLRVGRFDMCEVSGSVTELSATATSQIILVDDPSVQSQQYGNIINTEAEALQKRVIVNIKGYGDSFLNQAFSEPIKIRYGLSMYSLNVRPTIYIR